MPHEEDKSAANDKRVFAHFFFPLNEEVFFSELDKASKCSLPILQNIAKAFRRNLNSVMQTASVPFRLTHAGVHQLHFQRIHIAEKIRARNYIDNGESEEAAAEKALTNARKRFTEELGRDNSQTLVEHVISELSRSLERDELSQAAAELLRQGAVSVWGALEVLAQDIFVSLLNAKPTIAVELLTHERTKNIFQLKAIPLDTLEAKNFNLSNCFGDILINTRSVDTIPVMKGVFRVLLPNSEKLKDALEQKELWILNQRRHLIVHRRGIVDTSYIANTGDSLTIGSELTISPKELERYLTLVTDSGVKMIDEVSAHYK